MSTGEWIAAVFIFAIAGALLILGIRHYMEKGLLLNNAWLYASKEERKIMDKKPYYRQSAIVFFDAKCCVHHSRPVTGVSK